MYKKDKKGIKQMKEYIQNLFKDCSFFEDTSLTGDYFYEDIFSCLKDKDDLEYFSGASKAVLVPKETDYVIKMPFTGYFSDEEWENNFVNFEGTKNEENNWDYCLKETHIYQKAENAKVEKVFLKTTYEGTINNFPIYSQPKVSNFVEDGYVTCSKEEIESTREKVKKKNFNIFSPTWLFHAFNYYGEDYIFRLLSFIKEEEICDLHSGNLGWIGEQPVIVDYAGFDS